MEHTHGLVHHIEQKIQMVDNNEHSGEKSLLHILEEQKQALFLIHESINSNKKEEEDSEVDNIELLDKRNENGDRIINSLREDEFSTEDKDSLEKEVNNEQL